MRNACTGPGLGCDHLVLICLPGFWSGTKQWAPSNVLTGEPDGPQRMGRVLRIKGLYRSSGRWGEVPECSICGMDTFMHAGGGQVQ